MDERDDVLPALRCHDQAVVADGRQPRRSWSGARFSPKRVHRSMGRRLGYQVSRSEPAGSYTRLIPSEPETQPRPALTRIIDGVAYDVVWDGA